MKPISEAEVLDFLKPFVNLAREKRQKELDSYLTEFVNQVTALPEKNRQSIRARLRDLPTNQLIAASDRNMDEIQPALEGLLRDVTGE